MPQKKLFLLDAMALIYRAFYAFRRNPIINSKGLNTSAIYGFANTLFDILKREKPTHIGVVFDSRGATTRHEYFAEYKANREAMPEDISSALPYIMRLLEAFRIPVLKVEGYEADDIVGTLSKKAEELGFIVYMMTPDKDFGQLVSKNVLMYKPARSGKKPEILGEKEICNNFGIENPTQLIDFLGLSGDASDNIPGIPGVGPVTAKKLLKEFGSIENLINNKEQVKNQRIKNLVEEFAQQALLSKKLATIILNVPIAFEEKELKLKEPNKEKLKELLSELEFRAFAKRVFTDISLQNSDDGNIQKDLFSDTNNINNVSHKYELISTKEQRAKLIQDLKKKKFFCFDTETTNIDANSAELVGIAFSYVSNTAFYVTLPENYNDCFIILQEFKSIFEDKSISKTGQNLKYDISVLKWYEIEVEGQLFDTMLAHYLLEPDMRHNMDYLARNYLDYETVTIESLIGKKGKNQLSMRIVQTQYPEKVKDYACEDADITLQLQKVFEQKLKETGTENLFNNIEVPLINVLATMEMEGVKIDKEILQDYSVELKADIERAEKEIYERSGEVFNISSPKQLGEILFTKMNISEKAKKTKTGQYSTSEDVLLKLENKHPIIRDILDYRSLTKLKSTYVDALPLLINPRTGRIHTNFNQAVAATGRLSSNKPNLQNIPIRTAKGREIRKAFVPRNENYILLSADYSQIELRIIAHISGDEGMLEAFKQGQDIHSTTASKVYNVPVSEVNKTMRRNAKMVNFGIIYGISAFGLSERLGISRGEAADIIHQYFEKYPKIKKYMDDTIAFAEEKGYVETIMKRRRYLRDINSRNGMIRAYAKRNAINAPIQGSSADMIKIAMINIHNEIKKKKLKTKMIIQVHDELVFDVHKNEIDIIKSLVEEKMLSAIPLKVPLEIDMNTGKNWLEAH